MKKGIRLIALTIITLLFSGSGFASGERPGAELFFQANQAYREGRFQKAAEGYRQLIQSGYENGHIYYNLGNACFRLNLLGRAVLNYERARLFMPRDADLNFNLGYARDQTRDVIAGSRDFIGTTFFWLDSLSKDELYGGFAIFNLLFWSILLVRLFYRPEWTYYVALLLLVFWVIAGTSSGLKWHRVNNDDRAVILEEEVNILAGPEINDTVLFKLHEGTIVHRERSENGWALVRLPDAKRGWIKDVKIENINRKRPAGS